MSALTIPNRPFATEPISGLALPDGIFESTIGRQSINVHLKNTGFAVANATTVYIESTSDPNILVTPRTHTLNGLAGNAARILTWDANFAAATPGVHRVSFIVEQGSQRQRIIKKIFVTRVTFDPAARTFHALTPEGAIQVGFRSLFGPKKPCCGGRRVSEHDREQRGSFLDWIREYGANHDPNFRLCSPYYLPGELDAEVVATPPFAGQYGDLPFQDPWWKILLLIIAALLALGAAIAEALDGTGEVTVSTGTDDPSGAPTDCCGLEVEGGGTSYIAAGLLAAAAAVAVAAGASDARDPFRKGQDHTSPKPGELTTVERLSLRLSYPEPVALGRPFAVDAAFTYTRVTTGETYTYSASETNNNIHVLSRYEIAAPDVVRLYRRERFEVRARFFDAADRQLQGEQLFVQCLLAGPHGEFARFVLQDDGIAPDETPNDGTYTGSYLFGGKHADPRGLWQYYVIAQDVNSAKETMTPEEAAQIIGGLVVTHQLTIEFAEGPCALVPDGHVNVV